MRRQPLPTSKNRLQAVWMVNCVQLREFDGIVQSKDEEIVLPKMQLMEMRGAEWHNSSGHSNTGHSSSPSTVKLNSQNKRSGKAPQLIISQECQKRFCLMTSCHHWREHRCGINGVSWPSQR